MKIEDFDVASFLSCAGAPTLAPAISSAGAYAVILANPDSMPTVVPGKRGALYVGITDHGLDARNHFLHAHSGFSTLRRSLGALLKVALTLRALPRGPGSSKSNVRNYRFTDEGERALTAWMNDHLLLTQVAVEADLTALEDDLIVLLEPPLNLKGWQNPQRDMVKRLRAACAAEAEGNQTRKHSQSGEVLSITARQNHRQARPSQRG